MKYLLSAALSLGLTQAPAALADSLAAASNENRMETVTVRIQRVAQDRDDVAAPVSVISRDDIETFQARTLADLLDTVPGVTSEGGGRPEAMQPNIRGLGGARVVTRIDGARQNFDISHRGRAFIDPQLIGQVEILRGPGSTLYGSGAVGGVINFETLSADEFLRPGEQRGLRIAPGYQDNGDQFSGSLTGALRGERMGALASLGARDGDDYRDGDGSRVAFTRSDSRSALIKGYRDLGTGARLEVNFLGFADSSRSLTTADLPQGDEIDRDIDQRTISARYRGDKRSEGRLNPDIALYFTNLEIDEVRPDTGASRFNALETIGLDAVNTSFFTLGNQSGRLTYGIEAYRDRQTGLADGQPNPGFASSEQRTFGAFVDGELALTNRLSVNPGVRYDHITLDAESNDLESARLENVSPQITATYRFTPDLLAYASYSRAFRAPGLRQLFVGGPHFPGNEYIPNPDLRPEEAANREIGLRYTGRAVLTGTDRLELTLNGYQNDIDDFIEQVVFAATTQFVNVGEARVRGIEAQARYDLDTVYLLVGYQRLRGDNLERGEPLQSIPADEVVLTAARRWGAIDLETGARLSVTRAQDRVPDRPFTTVSTPSHEILDLFATWRPGGDALRIDLGVSNVFDQAYRRHLSQINQPGRTVRISVAYQL